MDEPIINLPTDVQEITAKAQEIEQYRVRKKLTISALLKKFASLGTDRTWNKIRNGDLSELNAAKWLERYRHVVNQISMETDRADVREALYNDLSAARHLESAFVDAMNETGNARFILTLGDTGLGKSSARQLLLEEYGDRIAWVEATDVWDDNVNDMLAEMLRVMGNEDPPRSKTGKLNKLVEKLNERRVFMICDEGHHLGPKSLNTIKTLINRTPGEFGVLAMKTLWRRLEREAYEEARQLTGNRLAALIDLSLQTDDVQKILSRRVPWEKGTDLGKLADLLLPRAAAKGNLALAREVAKAIDDMRQEGDATAALFAQALAQKGGVR